MPVAQLYRTSVLDPSSYSIEGFGVELERIVLSLDLLCNRVREEVSGSPCVPRRMPRSCFHLLLSLLIQHLKFTTLNSPIVHCSHFTHRSLSPRLCCRY